MLGGENNHRPHVFLHEPGDPACNVTLGTAQAARGASGGTASGTATAGAGCSWTALSLASWLGVTAGTSGTGSGSVSYGAAPNPSTSARSGIIAVGGQWLTVTQEPNLVACMYSLERSAVAIAGAGGSGSVKVFADSPCPWTAVSNDPAWLTISGGSTGSGAGTVSYAVAAQPSPGVRTGTLTVAGKTFTVTQVTAVSRIKLVSVGFDGLATDDNSSRFAPAISADGRWIAFDSKATNLVAGDTNGLSDIFVYDAQTATIARVSVGPGGAQADDNSGHPAISADGRFVAFTSFATNLVPGGTSGVSNVFVYDRQTVSTSRVSAGPGGAAANDASEFPAISADGRWVAFHSGADNLVAGDTNGLYDVFLYDRQTATTTRVSAAPGGANGNHASFFPAISADGARVAFVSFASNLVANDTNGAMDAFVYDRPTGTTTRVGAAAQANVPYYPPAISGDGRWVAYQFDDVFVYDMLTGTTRTASLRSDGTAASLSKQFPTISGDGRLVALDSDADLTGFDFSFLPTCSCTTS